MTEGVATKVFDASKPSLFVGIAGWKVTLTDAEAWLDALYRDDLECRGVGSLYAVTGPRRVFYEDKEVDVLALGRALVVSSPSSVVVAAHSSGAYIAHELLKGFATSDPTKALDDRVTYFELDGGKEGVTEAMFARTHQAYFVVATDTHTKTRTPEADVMKKIVGRFPKHAELLELPIEDSGCDAGIRWCMHMTLITTKPHERHKIGSALDYQDFRDRGAAHGWLDAALGVCKR